MVNILMSDGLFPFGNSLLFVAGLFYTIIIFCRYFPHLFFYFMVKKFAISYFQKYEL